MFTPNQEKAAAELARVVRKGGRIGLANWTPEGFIGQLLKIIGKHMPPPAGLKPPTLWGAEARLRELFAGYGMNISLQTFTFRYASPEHWLDVFRTYYGPANRAFASLGAAQQAALEDDILDLLRNCNRGGSSTLIVPGEYLEVVITKPYVEFVEGRRRSGRPAAGSFSLGRDAASLMRPCLRIAQAGAPHGTKAIRRRDADSRRGGRRHRLASFEATEPSLHTESGRRFACCARCADAFAGEKIASQSGQSDSFCKKFITASTILKNITYAHSI
jgi:hypothetical protein